MSAPNVQAKLDAIFNAHMKAELAGVTSYVAEPD